MNKRFFSLMTLLLLVVACAFAKPKVRIIATGGTLLVQELQLQVQHIQQVR